MNMDGSILIIRKTSNTEMFNRQRTLSLFYIIVRSLTFWRPTEQIIMINVVKKIASCVVAVVAFNFKLVIILTNQK